MIEYRKLGPDQMADCPWKSPMVVFIDPDRGEFSHGLVDKRSLLARRGSVLLMAWPGRYRQDVFKIRDSDRPAIQEALA
jgi:hypothetical protein